MRNWLTKPLAARELLTVSAVARFVGMALLAAACFRQDAFEVALVLAAYVAGALFMYYRVAYVIES